jgi:hypothetical protein
MKQCASFLALMLVGVSLALAQSPAGTHPKKLTAAAQSDSKPKFKAIWEPVNYKEDLYLSDVFFVSKEEGWVSGAAGTILHTKDGGNSWAAQLGGDPHAEGVELTNLFFADATHGWAQASTSLFRTTDGESWEHVTGDIRGKLFFVSDTKGFRVYGPTLFATTDGGENWKEIFTCQDGSSRIDAGERVQSWKYSVPQCKRGLCRGRGARRCQNTRWRRHLDGAGGTGGTGRSTGMEFVLPGCKHRLRNPLQRSVEANDGWRPDLERRHCAARPDYCYEHQIRRPGNRLVHSRDNMGLHRGWRKSLDYAPGSSPCRRTLLQPTHSGPGLCGGRSRHDLSLSHRTHRLHIEGNVGGTHDAGGLCAPKLVELSTALREAAEGCGQRQRDSITDDTADPRMRAQASGARCLSCVPQGRGARPGERDGHVSHPWRCASSAEMRQDDRRYF